MKNKILITLLTFALAAVPRVFACSMESCANQYEIVPPKLARARAVFIGRVTKIDRNESLKDVEFEVSKVFKGQLGDTVTVNSENVGFSEVDCGIDFLVGEEYLVYAYGIVTEPGDEYSVEACGGARKLSCAGYEIFSLERLTRSLAQNK